MAAQLGFGLGSRGAIAHRLNRVGTRDSGVGFPHVGLRARPITLSLGFSPITPRPALTISRAGGNNRLDLAPLRPEDYPAWITQQSNLLDLIEILAIVCEPIRKLNAIIKSFQIWVKILKWLWEIIKDIIDKKRNDDAAKEKKEDNLLA